MTISKPLPASPIRNGGGLRPPLEALAAPAQSQLPVQSGPAPGPEDDQYSEIAPAEASTPAAQLAAARAKRSGGRRPGTSSTLARSELIFELRRALGVSAAAANSGLEALEGAIRTALIRGETVRLCGIGTLLPVPPSERTFHNPYTGANYVASPARVKFKANKELRIAIADGA